MTPRPAGGRGRLLLATVWVILFGCGAEPEREPEREPAARSDGEARALPRYDARAFHEGVTLSMASADGFPVTADDRQLLVSTDESGIFNAALIDLDSGAHRRVTDSTTDAVQAVSVFPRDERLLVLSDSGGNERYHLYVREHDGTLTDLTPGDEVRALFAGWTETGDGFYVLTNEIDPRQMDLYRYRSDDYQRELLYRNEHAYSIEAVSRDGRWLAVLEELSNDDADVLLIDLTADAPEAVNVTPGEEPVAHQVHGFTPDSAALLIGSNAGDEFYYVLRHELASGAQSRYLDADWDIPYVTFSRSGRYRVWAVNEDARTRLVIDDLQTGKGLEQVQLPTGDINQVRFDRAERRLMFLSSSDVARPEVYVAALDGSRLERLTRASNPAIDENQLVHSEVVRYPSFDGLEIPAILYRPREAAADHPVPALVWVHGGPGGQSRTGFNPIIQHLVNHGYAVLAANNRGSSGYGKRFFHMDDRRHGEVDLDDIVYGKRYLAGLDWVDAERIGVIGGSYGGYLTVAALAFRPEEFRVGIDIFGVTNWVRTLESIPPWWESMRRSLYAELGDPAVDGERLRRISPLFHAERIERPMLVIQGANDPRVLKVESDEIVETVRANEVPVEYLVFPDEGHGFSGKENRIAASEAMLGFLQKHL
ncbi:MAG TPA: S9 family peptidase [Pseudomonadales bacterium]